MPQTHLTPLTLLGFAAAFAVTQVEAATLAEIKQRGYLVVAVSDEASPFGAVQDGKRVGFDADLLASFSRSVQLDIRQKIVPAAELTDGIRSGEADIAATSVEVTQERQKIVDFGLPVAEATLYYLKRKGDDRIRSVHDLDGHRFGIRSGSASFLELTELEHLIVKAGGQLGEPVTYDGLSQAYQDLAASRIDYVVGDVATLEAAVKSQPDAFEIGQRVSHKIYVGWELAKGSDELRDLLKNFLLQERKNGELAALQQKYLGRGFTDLPDDVTAQDWWVAREDRPAVLPIPYRDPQYPD